MTKRLAVRVTPHSRTVEQDAELRRIWRVAAETGR